MLTAVALHFRPPTYTESIHVRTNALLLIVESSGLEYLFEQWCKLVETYKGCVALSGSLFSMLTITAFIVLRFIKFVTSTPDR